MANATLTAPAPRPAPAKLYGLMAEFTTPAQITHAAERVKPAGYKWWDCHVPFPVHGLDKVMGVRPTILPVILFLCALTGPLARLRLQFFTTPLQWTLWAFVWLSGIPSRSAAS